jgi:threonyl-tRNA synthetase
MAHASSCAPGFSHCGGKSCPRAAPEQPLASSAVKVVLPDESELELPDRATGAELAAAIGAGLARAALAVRVGEEVRDLSAPLGDGERVEILTAKSTGALELVRHDAAHVMATAVMELYPGTKISIGPPIEDGFYYDFEFPEGTRVTDEDLSRIEERMREHVKADERFERSDVPVEDAERYFASQGQDYKVELIRDLVSGDGVRTVSLYRNGPFTDLCLGPHGPSTGRIKAFKLLSLAGAYWRGDEHNKMLTRIYGTAFFSAEDLERHLERLEQARARDHRRLGPQHGLFTFRRESPGMPFFLPRGMVVINEIQRVVREQLDKRGYVEIRTPQLLDVELWKRSGHYENYRENMYFTREGEGGREFAIKPMNCPGACLVYSSGRRSYRDLPLRLAEFGLCTRNEREGVLHGLLRVRAFTQDDAHVYCMEEQVVDEVRDITSAIDELYALFGFDDVRVELSTRPDKSIGTDEQWESAEAALEQALESMDREYKLNPGDGAFYGPKIDFHITDALGRSWQCGTCQLDFFMPERFELTYTAADNLERTPVMIHRALLGSIERFLGILIEHHAGELPVWLAPVQARVLPIADRHAGYATDVERLLREAGVRGETDLRSESVGKKIRDAELEKIPYMLVVGDSEQDSGQVAVRRHREGDIGAMEPGEVAQKIRKER